MIRSPTHDGLSLMQMAEGTEWVHCAYYILIVWITCYYYRFTRCFISMAHRKRPILSSSFGFIVKFVCIDTEGIRNTRFASFSFVVS